ncbi:acetyl-CoA synthetase-like protein [Lophiostoma macrostomum CBS 122681]|uniref:Acetyl-CoA synthetase-like protein n=1 Tax=Lophiostoma macrostomum CBS 122681 TaxID=1314788 RepID=A0A6A6T7X2_9PLEO|nr:acetyl-CoA synthetase-like protein [Lophiostoma macrostomum CBS 122681]
MAITGNSTSGKPDSSFIAGPTSPSLLQWTLNDVLHQRCLDQADDVAVISQQQDEHYTYGQLQDRSTQLAAGLNALGVRQGDRVGVLLGNRAEYVDILFACSKLGAYFTLFNYAYSHSELANAMRATTPKVLLTTLTTSRYDYTSVLATLQGLVPELQDIILLDDISQGAPTGQIESSFMTYHDVISRGRWSPVKIATLENSVQNSHILNLQFTSGSTGLPKAAALTHHGMLNSAKYIGDQMRVGKKDRINVPVPLFHAFGLIMGVLNAAAHGATVVLPSEYFDASATLRAVERYQCTGLYGVTTMFVDMLSHPTFPSTSRKSLRFGMMAGSSMPEELLYRVMTRFPIRDLYTNWGMTELSSVATMTTASDPVDKKMKTAGRLLPNFMAKIVDSSTMRTLPWGHRGEIVVSGFGVMHSYYNDPTRTAEAIRHHPSANDDQRWMHTGDEGYLDDDGYFVITGRIKDLIIRGGENISPLEIEARLYQHPAIKQAAVFGVPSARYGEEVAAMLELEEDFNGQRPSQKDIKDWVRMELSRFKTPVYVWWLGDEALGVPNEWPKTANGKLRKGDIRKIGEELLKTQKNTGSVEIRALL